MADDERQEKQMQPERQSPDASGRSADAQNALAPELRGAIGQQLKQVYSQMLKDPLPDKFAQLLADLSKQGK